MEIHEFSSLIDEYGNCIYRFCKGMTYTTEDAEDLYQQTFLVAFEKRHKLDRGGNVKAYLMQIASNLWKSHKTTYARHERIAPTVSFDNMEVDIADDNMDISENVVNEDEKQMLRTSIDKLPDKLKQVVVMFYGSELSIEEISKVLHIPKGTVKSRLHNAKEQLKDLLEGEVSI
ncbi:MAG: RNA polymerase sigma factor [Lachnospiraceae bacterium]|nr:RNA polymerase sigma factor [Lachnospiraceae bacterium]